MNFDPTAAGTLVTYPDYDPRIERDYVYDVAVTQGSESRRLTCYNHCDAVATSPRTVNGDAVRRFCEFAFDGAPVRIDFTVKQDFDSYTVMPSAKGFRSERRGNVISVYLEKPDYFLLKLDDKDDSILSVFADAPEADVPEKSDPNVLYVEGWVQPDGWRLDVDRDDVTVYLAPGSVLNARLFITGKRVAVRGRGILLDPISDIYRLPANTDYSVSETDKTIVRCLHVRGDGCTVDGIKMIDARTFNLFVSASNVTVTNFKVLSSEMCTDGITQSGGDGNRYEHVFIYNGDNGIVITGGKDQKYRDVTIGTICCGVFPQLGAGEIDVDGLYLFRADEGLMRNMYNPRHVPQTFDIKLANVSCVDCDHFPFLFMFGNMGDLKKTVTFRNLAAPCATGANHKRTPDPAAANVQRATRADYIESSHYELIFDGLSLDGKPVTDPAQIVLGDDVGDAVAITVKGNGAAWPAVPAAVPGSVVAPGKLFIGNRQLFLRDPVVEQNGVWFVPAGPVCRALACDVPAGTVTIHGVEYVPLDALVSGSCAASAVYDAASQSVRIAPVDRGDNLLAWGGNAVHSRWSEYTCYNTHLLYVRDSAGDYYYSKNAVPGAGASYLLTDQFNQYGAGVYTLSMDMKADAPCTATVRLRGADPASVELDAMWRRVTLSFSFAEDSYPNAALIITHPLKGEGISFRDPVLTHSR